MRTTVRIKDDLFKRAKKRGAEQGRSPTSLKDGLVLVLALGKEGPAQPVKLLMTKASGGVFPGVDLNLSCELHGVMNEP